MLSEPTMPASTPLSPAARPDRTPGQWGLVILLGALVVAMPALGGCGGSDQDAATVKISIYKDGGLIVSGFRTDPTKFDVAVARMKEKKTTVWLYDEPAKGIGTAIERNVRAQLAQAGIPVRIYADEGFTQPESTP